MSKSPQGVYVSEAVHNRVSMLVENALDGHGTLAGFIAHLEAATLGVAREYERAPDRFARGKEALKALKEAPKEGTASSTWRSEYEPAWRALTAELPWSDTDPCAHVVALFLLSRDARLWRHDEAFDAQGVVIQDSIDIGDVIGDLVRIGKGQGPRYVAGGAHLGVRRPGEIAAVLWKGDTLEVILDEPKSRSTSFYLDDEAHRLAVSVFGRGLFDRVEKGLARLLDSISNWLPWEAEFNFLEHGSALVEYQDPHLTKQDGKQLIEDFEEEDEFYREHVLPRIGGDPRFSKHQFPFSWAGMRDPWHLVHPLPKDWIAAKHNTLVVAFRLGLFDPRDGADADAIRRRLLPAFLERYGLTAIGPERRLAYEVIRQMPYRHSGTEHITNALDYHLFRLFQTYAMSVLPPEEREERRVDLCALATLSQPWIFPTKATLEAYGNAKAIKTATGAWELVGKRKTALRLTDEEAYWTAKALNTVVTVLPMQTLQPTLPARWDDDRSRAAFPAIDGPAIARSWASSLEKLRVGTRVQLPLGSGVIEAARATIGEMGERPSPLLAGMKVMATHTDTALEADGEFAKEFLRCLGYEDLLEAA